MPAEYKSQRHDIAEIIARMASGLKSAVPEPSDFDLADELIVIIEKRLSGVE